jgi:tetratricopeptide (TPR) repeat protein
LKKYDKAIADHNRAVQIEPRNAINYTNRGAAYYGLKKYEKAVSDYDKAIQLDAQYAMAYYNRGGVHAVLGNKKKAIADYQRSADIYKKQGSDANYQDALEQAKSLGG